MSLTPLQTETGSLVARFEIEPNHVRHVARLALSIYDQLRRQIDEPPRSRELLECAALLHDIGWSQTASGKHHHKLSAHMIREHPWQHLDTSEIHVTALIARYHRKSPPKPSHDEFQRLVPALQHRVSALAAILRLADALDRSHHQTVASVEVSLSGGTAHFTIFPAGTPGSLAEEIAAFHAKKDLFESWFRLPAELSLSAVPT